MGIMNAISLGGGAWTAVANTTASSTAISFPASHTPTEWAVFRITDAIVSSSTWTICYITKNNGTYYEYSVNYSRGEGHLSKRGTPTGTYSNGTFTVTRGTASFTASAGAYVLVYI